MRSRRTCSTGWMPTGRAANYLSVGQIYLYDNPLLKRPLALADIKHMLLGHWGTTPGQNFIYTHLNRAIKQHDLNMIYGVWSRAPAARPLWATRTLRARTARSIPRSARTRPGFANSLSSSRFPAASRAMPRRRRPARSTKAANWVIRLATRSARCSTTPTSFVACVVGDGEAETGPLATSWHSNKFLNPAPTARCCRSCTSTATRLPTRPCWHACTREELDLLMRGYGYDAGVRRRPRSQADAPRTWPQRSTRCGRVRSSQIQQHAHVTATPRCRDIRVGQ